MPAAYPILVADIGGTHARFGLVYGRAQSPADVKTLPGEDYPSLQAALTAYLKSAGSPTPRRGCIAVAGPVQPGQFTLTNRPQWNTSLAPLKAAYRLDELDVINDFAALAAALPLIEPHEIEPIGPPLIGEAGAPVAVVGPGTGLGVGAAVRTSAGWQALPGEGGHIELASADPEGRAAIAHAASIHGRVSAERFLSGPGLERLHVTLGAVAGDTRQPLDAATIHERAKAADQDCLHTISMFFRLLAGFAGDVALVLGAKGGVFLAGGVTARLHDFIDHQSFRAAFENKGRLKSFMAAIPTSLIASDTLALRGCAAHLEAHNYSGDRDHG